MQFYAHKLHFVREKKTTKYSVIIALSLIFIHLARKKTTKCENIRIRKQTFVDTFS